MTRIENGRYVTKAGSTVVVSGAHRGAFTVEFDWLEEGGCIDCTPIERPQLDDGELWLEWVCDECGGGRTPLGVAP